MFKILQKTVATGIATVAYPDVPAVVSGNFRGRPQFNFGSWRDARPAAEVCPTGAIALSGSDTVRRVTVDYGLCVFCGQCADVSPDGAVEITTEFELATHYRSSLIQVADYKLNPDGTHEQFIAEYEAEVTGEDVGRKVSDAIRETLGRSLAIRQVDAGSCNGCEIEIVALNNPIHDIERFGIHFVASPRHADMLLVTGPVTRNMELALLKTYAATPDPKLSWRLVPAASAAESSARTMRREVVSTAPFLWMSISPDVRRALKRCSTASCLRWAGCRREFGK
jgi:formate hydrogenlyase subunit 6/NADH:ubiquinone oxidoreductase subunit I